MKKISASTEFVVGLCVVLAVVILVFGTMWFGEIRLNEERYLIEAIFDNAGGLQVGDPVMVAGLSTGGVRSISLSEEGVMVTMWLPNSAKIPTDSRVLIQNNGLMGEKQVSIIPGQDGTIVEDGHVFYGKYSGGILEAGDQTEELLAKLDHLIVAVEKTIASERRQQQVDSIMINVQDLTNNTKVFTADAVEILHTTQGDIQQTAENIRVISEDIREVVSTRKSTVDSTLIHVNRATARFETVMARVDSLAIALNQVTDKINNGDGLVNKVLDDEMLYQDLRMVLYNLNELVIDVQKNPQKYLTVELF